MLDIVETCKIFIYQENKYFDGVILIKGMWFKFRTMKWKKELWSLILLTTMLRCNQISI